VIEKPMVMRIEEGYELKKIADVNNVNVFPVFQNRFNKAVKRVKRAVENNELGDIVLGTIRLRWCRPQRYYDRDPWRGTYALDGGASTNQGIHHLDLLRYLGGEIKNVSCVMNTLGVDVEVEDTVTATFEFVAGGQGVIEITTAARPDDFEASITIMGNKGIAIIGGWATNELTEFSLDKNEENKFTEVFPDVYGFGHKEIYDGIYNKLVNNGPPAIEFEDAFNSIKLLHSLYSSDEKREWVEIKDEESSSRLGIPNESLSNLYRTKKNY
jgi:predicted dehydrogenase